MTKQIEVQQQQNEVQQQHIEVCGMGFEIIIRCISANKSTG
jgi:hypothetical protein